MSAYYRFISRNTDADGVCVAHYEPLLPAQGAWNAHEQHMAPATGVMCAELEAFMPREDLRIGRVGLDILGLIPLQPFSISTKVLRPGKTIELIEATMVANGRACIVARAWRMQTSDTRAIAGMEDRDIKRPETCLIGRACSNGQAVSLNPCNSKPMPSAERAKGWCG